MNCYRVWYWDSTARLIDAESPEQAKTEAERLSKEQGYSARASTVREVEDLTAAAQAVPAPRWGGR